MTDVSTRDSVRSVAGGEAASPTRVPAVVKTIAIIRSLNTGPSAGRTLAELAADLGITKSHCHNILKTLVAEGWAEFDASRRRYALAPHLLSDVSRLIGRRDGPQVPHEELVRLSAAARVPCVVTRIDRDGSFVAVDKAEEAAELLVSVPIGHRFPPDAPAQMRIRLAYADEATRREALRRWQPTAYTPATIVDRNELAREIADTRRRGYAISRGEFTLGVMSLAAPILDPFGAVQLIVQCPGLQADIEERERQIASLLLEMVRRISALHRSGI